MGFSGECSDLKTMRIIKSQVFKSLFPYQYENVYFNVAYSYSRKGNNYCFKYYMHNWGEKEISIPISKIDSVKRNNKFLKISDKNEQVYTKDEILSVIRKQFKFEVVRYNEGDVKDIVSFSKSKHSDDYVAKYFNTNKKEIAQYRIDMIKVHSIVDRNRNNN